MIINRYVLGMCQTNCYLVVDENSGECIVIDPGSMSQKLESDIETNNYTVKYIIFTHGHFDHIGGMEHYMNKYDKSLVVMHKNDIEAIVNEIDVFYVDMKNKENTVKKITLHSDSDVVSIGDTELSIIHTPGHTKGGICLYTDGVLFSGDTLFERSIGRTDFPGGDFKVLEASIKKLYNLPDNTVVYPGHGDTTTILDEKNGNPFVRL